MNRISRMLLVPLVAASVLLGGCAPLLSALMTGSSAPPQLPAAALNISRGALDFALNSFDAALYGLDFAMDVGKITPGSDKAKAIAKAGRTVMAALGVAEAARDLGNSATYEEAFAKANAALKDFRTLLGQSPTAAAYSPLTPHLAQRSRTEILDRAAA